MQQPVWTTSPVLRILCPMGFLLSCAYGGLLSPLLPLLRDTFDVSYSTLGLLTSLFGLSGVVMDSLATVVVRRKHLPSALVASLVLTELGLLGCLAAPDFFWLAGSRVVFGFGVSLTGLVSLTILAYLTPPTAQARANNLLEFASIAGSAVSPLVAGFAAALLHWRAAFGLAMVFVTGALFWVVKTCSGLQEMLTKPSEQPARVAASTGQVCRTVPGDPVPTQELRGLCVVSIAAFVLSFIRAGFLSTALPLFGGEVLKLSPAALGSLFTGGLLVNLTLLLPVGWLSDRLGLRLVFAPAMLLIAIALLWLPHARTFASLFLVSLGMHAGFAAWGLTAAALALLTSQAHLSRVFGLYRILVDGAVILAPWFTGVLIGTYGYRLPAQTSAVALLLTAALLIWGLKPWRH